MSDISSLFQYAPTTAGGFVGSNQGLQEIMEKIKQQELQQLISSRTQDQQFNAQKQPFELDKLGLANDTTRAQLPGVIGDSSLKQTNAAKAAGTLDSDIAAGNTKNSMQMYEELGNHLNSLGSAIDNNPNVPPHVAMTNAITDLGIPQKQAEAFMRRYSNVPPADLRAKLFEDNLRILREHPANAQAFDTAAMHGDSAMATTKEHGASAERVERIREEARLKAAAARTAAREVTIDQSIRAAKTATERYQKLNDAAMEMQQAGNPEAAERYRARAAEIYPQVVEELKKGKQPGLDAPGMTGLPAEAPPNPAPPSAAKPAPNVDPKKIQSLADVKKSFPKYANVPDAMLKEAWKQQYGVDLK